MRSQGWFFALKPIGVSFTPTEVTIFSQSQPFAEHDEKKYLVLFFKKTVSIQKTYL